MLCSFYCTLFLLKAFCIQEEEAGLSVCVLVNICLLASDLMVFV